MYQVYDLKSVRFIAEKVFMYKIYDSLIWFLTINRKWENSKDKKQVLQNKITIYTKNSTMKDMMRRAVGDTVLVA